MPHSCCRVVCAERGSMCQVSSWLWWELGTESNEKACGSVLEHLPAVCKAMGLVPSTRKWKKEQEDTGSAVFYSSQFKFRVTRSNQPNNFQCQCPESEDVGQTLTLLELSNSVGRRGGRLSWHLPSNIQLLIPVVQGVKTPHLQKLTISPLGFLLK